MYAYVSPFLFFLLLILCPIEFKQEYVEAKNVYYGDKSQQLREFKRIIRRRISGRTESIFDSKCHDNRKVSISIALKFQQVDVKRNDFDNGTVKFDWTDLYVNRNAKRNNQLLRNKVTFFEPSNSWLRFRESPNV